MKARILGLAAALVLVGGTLFVLTCGALAEEPVKSESPPGDSGSKARLRTGREAIEAALAEKTDLDVSELPLDEALRRLRMKHHIQILFDAGALKDAAIDPAALPVTLQVKNISLRSALKLLLSQFQLTYVLNDDVLQITTRDKAGTMLVTQVYDVANLLAADEHGKPDFDSLIDVITTTIAPQTWSETGGPGEIMPLEPAMLVIPQTQEIHEQIASLFQNMRAAMDQAKSGKFASAGVADQSGAEKLILKILEQKADLDFQDTPLKEVAARLDKDYHLPIQIESGGLTNAAIDPSQTQITYNVKGITLRSALNVMLDQAQLAWLVEDEVPIITSKDKANATLRTVIYPIGDLVPPADDRQGPNSNDAGQLMDTVQGTVAKDTWSSVGGPASIQTYKKDSSMLVISQTRAGHEQVADMLSQIREVRKKQIDDAAKEKKEADPNAMVLRVYDLRVAAPNAPAMAPQEVMEVVKGLVDPKGWGQGDAFIRGATGKLIVRQTPAVQADVKKLLDDIGATPVKFEDMGKGRRGRRGNAPNAVGAAAGAVPGGGGF